MSGLLTNTARHHDQRRPLNGGATVSGGTLTTTGTIAGGLSNSATVNANGGAVNGAIANNAGGTFNVGGTLTGNSTFGNANGATLAVGTTGNYTLQGLLTNSGVITVANGGQLIATVGGITNMPAAPSRSPPAAACTDDLNNAGTVSNSGAYVANVATNTGSITNNGTWTGNVVSNTGTITNNLTWTGTVNNAGTFNNNAGATVSGLLTNSGSDQQCGNAERRSHQHRRHDQQHRLHRRHDDGHRRHADRQRFGRQPHVGSGATFAPGTGTAGSSATVNGSLALASGAIYLVQINPATSSFANVKATATLGGATVNAVYANGSYVAKQYTILTAGERERHVRRHRQHQFAVGLQDQPEL